MADKTIGELPVASEVYDDSLLVMEQQGEARSIKGELLKKYARKATAAYVEDAKKSAEEGKRYRDAAAESAQAAVDVALHPPVLKDENDHWWIWDAELDDYKDSGIDAGVSLTVSPETVTGEPGSAAKVENIGTETDPVLRFTIPRGENGEAGDAGLPPHLIVGKDSDLGTVLPVDADTLEGHPASHFVPKGELETELEKKQDVLPYYSNPNLLDNWYFVGGGSQRGGGQFPINQRGQTEYVSADVPYMYTIDRWAIQSGLRLQLEEDGVLFSYAGTVAWLYQLVESPEKYVGKTVTFSVLVTGEENSKITFAIRDEATRWSEAPKDTVNIQDFQKGETKLVSVTATIENGLSILIIQALSETSAIKIAAAKLELGSQQTLAHKEGDTWVLNEIPNYAEELAKCQRYMQVIDACDYPVIAPFDAYTARLSYPLSQPMRATPTLVVDKNFVLMANGSFNDEGIVNHEVGIWPAPNDVNDQLVSISVTSKEGFPFKAGTPYLLFKIGKTAKIILDANL